MYPVGDLLYTGTAATGETRRHFFSNSERSPKSSIYLGVLAARLDNITRTKYLHKVISSGPFPIQMGEAKRSRNYIHLRKLSPGHINELFCSNPRNISIILIME